MVNLGVHLRRCSFQTVFIPDDPFDLLFKINKYEGWVSIHPLHHPKHIWVSLFTIINDNCILDPGRTKTVFTPRYWLTTQCQVKLEILSKISFWSWKLIFEFGVNTVLWTWPLKWTLFNGVYDWVILNIIPGEHAYFFVSIMRLYSIFRVIYHWPCLPNFGTSSCYWWGPVGRKTFLTIDV